MNKIFFPEWLSKEYYDKTLMDNPMIILDELYDGPETDHYKQSREALRDNYELTYICDFWLDGFCFQVKSTKFTVPAQVIIKHIEKYYEQTIPIGCLILAIKHRNEKHRMSSNGLQLHLVMDERAYEKYKEIYGE